MKRRDFIGIITFGLMCVKLSGCSFLGFTYGSPNVKNNDVPNKKSTGESSNQRTSRRSRNSSRISDIKTLSKMLQQARRPLSNNQVEYLLTLKPGPEFCQKMMDILTDSQKEALKNASGGRRRRRR